MTYVPSTGTGTRTTTVDMSRLSGPAMARWYNPTNGTYTPITDSPLANTGSRELTISGDNGTGTNDWVLVLESAPLPFHAGDSEDSSAGKSDPAAAAELATTVGLSSRAQSFREILRTCLEAPNCELMTIYGVTDKWHWLVLAGPSLRESPKSCIPSSSY